MSAITSGKTEKFSESGNSKFRLMLLHDWIRTMQWNSTYCKFQRTSHTL